MGLSPDNKVGDPNYHFLETSHIPLKFEGNAARLLGIRGTFDRDAYDRLFRGFAPELENGKEKKLAARIDKDRIGAVDWTFTRPKSVSVAKLVGGDSRIDAVEDRAEAAAMKRLESEARVRVRKQAEIDRSKAKHPKGWKYPERYTDNLLWVAHRHGSNRDGDPHDHTHIVIFNLSYDKEEKAWKALELRYADRKAINDVYRKEMRKGLAELGYTTRAVGQEYEIAGFPAEIKAKFSQRHETIKGIEREYETRAGKPMSAKARGKLHDYDKPDKPEDRPLKERKAAWVSRLTDFEHSTVRRVVKRAKEAVSHLRLKSGIQRHLASMRRTVLEIIPTRGQEIER